MLREASLSSLPGATIAVVVSAVSSAKRRVGSECRSEDKSAYGEFAERVAGRGLHRYALDVGGSERPLSGRVVVCLRERVRGVLSRRNSGLRGLLEVDADNGAGVSDRCAEMVGGR